MGSARTQQPIQTFHAIPDTLAKPLRTRERPPLSGTILGCLPVLPGQPQAVRTQATAFFCEESDRGQARSTSGARRAGIPPPITGSLKMYQELKEARWSAYRLSRTMMAGAAVIAVGNGYAVIASEDIDPSVTVIHEYDPFN